MADAILNWNRTVSFTPARVEAPRDLGELQQIVAGAERVRAKGRHAHSMTPCMETDGVLLDLSNFDSVRLNDASTRVIVGGGATLLDVRAKLQPRGLQLPVMPEIGNATAGSAACCGTKDSSLGTGPGQVSTAVTSISFVDANGAAQVANTPQRLHELRSSYGLLGVVHEVEFRVESLQTLEYTYETIAVARGAVPDLATVRAGADGFLGFFHPYTGRLLVERRKRASGAPITDDDVRRRGIRNWMWEWGATDFAELTKFLRRPMFLNGLLGMLAGNVLALKTGWLFELIQGFKASRADCMIDFSDPRERFFEFTFWAFPEGRWSQVVGAYMEFCAKWERDQRFRPTLFTEIYYIQPDQDDQGALLSFAPGQAAGGGEAIFTLDMVHTFATGDVQPAKRDDYRKWQAMNEAYNAFAADNGGRPLLNQTKEISRPVVERAYKATDPTSPWNAFRALVKAEDPTGKFRNPFFRGLLDLNP